MDNAAKVCSQLRIEPDPTLDCDCTGDDPGETDTFLGGGLKFTIQQDGASVVGVLALKHFTAD